MKNIRHSIDRNAMNLIVCIGEILIGALLLINPIGFTSAVLIALGVVLVALGAIRLVGYFRSDPEAAAQGGGLVTGLLFMLAGLFCIFRWEWFVVTFLILRVVYGVVRLAEGVHKLQWAVDALRLGQRYWYIAIIGAALTLIFGALIVFNPFTTTTVLWTFIAVSLIVEAVLDILSFVLGKR